MDNLIRKVEELVQAQEATNTSMQRLISKRGINPSKNLSSPYTPVHVRRRGKAIAKALASVRSRRSVATPSKSIETPLLDVGPKVLKKVDIFKPVHAQRKKKVETAIKSKKSGRTMYSMHEFGAADFKALTSMEIWWEDWYVDEVLLLMRMRQINFPEYYDSTDIILDLNFYNNMSKRYAELTKESTVPNAVPLKVRLAEFKWDDDMVDYCRGVRPYPGGCSWAGAKRVLTVMNINVTHFVTLEFMIEEGVVNVYDCNVPVYEESDFFCFMEPVMELWPKLLQQSGMFAHLPAKLLNESWEFNRLQNLPRNVTSKACGSWSIAFIEALLTGTTVTKPESLISDNSVGRMQWRWALGIIEKVLEP
ncbi:uncharacterized protein LOC132029407 isoform X1 [Lycium ferocissimum]|uniref:uncharacterized protein LOC132029407 isoform X1 n=1 Tax=Lycium ferocissimum TaxID=112874 RepID=UPI002814C5A1|nr:uncharacterized protein LOC132029407 isoform X1 [Lycium ferocissimum]